MCIFRRGKIRSDGGLLAKMVDKAEVVVASFFSIAYDEGLRTLMIFRFNRHYTKAKMEAKM